MKNLLSLLIGSVVFIGSIPNVMAADSFPDVNRNNPNYGAIEFLQEAGIVKGYPDGTFGPKKAINRAEALKIVLLAKEYLGEKVTVDDLKTIEFPDVGQNDWYYNFVRLALSAGIIEGYPDGTFKPAQTVNAVESLKMALKTIDDQFEEYEVVENPYADIQADEWYATYVDYAKEAQIIEAFGDYKYIPDREMTRGEFSEIVFRLIYILKNEQSKYPLSLNWNYCNNYQEGYKIKYPHSWEKYVAGDQAIFWKQDIANGQVSFARVFPNSATVIVVSDDNVQGLTLEQYIDLIDYGENAQKQFLTLNEIPYASVYIEATGLQDSYFEMPDGTILIVYSQVGSGILAPQLKEQIRYMIGSIRESNSPSELEFENCGEIKNEQNNDEDLEENATTEDVLTQLLKNVLISGKASESIKLIEDFVIFETDTIGIGTGPVDYYYSEEYNLTVKVDRESDTILATKKDKTSSF
ncbi:hypothetical protein GF376_00155 [Candidatus Peregrinibacteria bacterium]|nr:hypothetical protein [Candidatus Peregrinibacteria bacterium]